MRRNGPRAKELCPQPESPIDGRAALTRPDTQVAGRRRLRRSCQGRTPSPSEPYDRVAPRGCLDRERSAASTQIRHRPVTESDGHISSHRSWPVPVAAAWRQLPSGGPRGRAISPYCVSVIARIGMNSITARARARDRQKKYRVPTRNGSAPIHTARRNGFRDIGDMAGTLGRSRMHVR